MKRHTLTQVERVVLAGLAAGPRGICQADFLAPNVVDGRGQITRLASRVTDARERGHQVRTAGKRHGFVVYVFEGAPRAAEHAPVPAPTPVAVDVGPVADALFEAPVARPVSSAYDPFQDAA